MMSTSDNFFMRYATAIAIIAVTLLMGASAVIFYQQGAASVTARQWVDHTFEVKGHIQQLQNDLADAETGQRAYMFSGDELFLDPYKESLRNSPDNRPKSDDLGQHHSIVEEQEILRRMTSDNPVEQQNMDDADTAIKNILAYMDYLDHPA